MSNLITEIIAFSKKIVLPSEREESDFDSKDRVISILRDLDEESANEIVQTNFEYRIEEHKLVILRTDASFG